jgi:hypothetical protein
LVICGLSAMVTDYTGSTRRMVYCGEARQLQQSREEFAQSGQISPRRKLSFSPRNARRPGPTLSRAELACFSKQLGNTHEPPAHGLRDAIYDHMIISPSCSSELLRVCLNHCKFTASKGIALALLLYVHQSDNHVYGSLTSFWCSLL